MDFKQIFIHCSDSDYGCAMVINKWHLARGWSGGIGYHFVIDNGKPYEGMQSGWGVLNGSIEAGRHLNDDTKITPDEEGAHVYGFNSSSIGICMIGKTSFSEPQFIKLRFLVSELCTKLIIPPTEVYGHCEAGKVDPKFATTKTCPNFNVSDFRLFCQDKLTLHDLMMRTRAYIRDTLKLT